MISYLVDYYEEAIRFKTIEIKADSYEEALKEAEKYNNTKLEGADWNTTHIGFDTNFEEFPDGI